MNINLSLCPTCRSHKIEVAPGVWTWPENATYKLYDEVHYCDCAWQENLQRHYLLAGIPRNYWTLSRDDFFGDPNALAEVEGYLASWDNAKWHGLGLKLYSPTLGTGKTMLATIVARTLIKRGERVYFVPFRDTLRIYDMPFEQRDPLVRRLRNTPVLVLDEVTAGISEAQQAFFAIELEDLIRFRTSGNSVTIITTNLTPEQLEDHYPRTFSLLAPKVKHVGVKGMDARKSGDVDLMNQELILNGEVRPIV